MRYTTNGHDILDTRTGDTVATWGYDHGEFARSGQIYRVTFPQAPVPVHTADLDSLIRRWG